MIVAFLRLSRLQFLLGGFIGVAFGVCLAAFVSGLGVVAAGTYFRTQLVVTMFQLMTHYTNDYFDRERDLLSRRTAFSGGSGVLCEGGFDARYALLAAAVCATIAVAALISIGKSGNVLASTIGIVIGALAYSYSSPPLRLFARGMGEAATALVVAVLVPLFAMICTNGRVPGAVALCSVLPGACAMFIMMLCVEFPDVVSDEATGKRNLVVRFGRNAAITMMRRATVALYLCAGAAFLSGGPWTLPALCALTAPFAVSVIRCAHAACDPEFQPNARLARAGVSLFLVTIGSSALAYAAFL